MTTDNGTRGFFAIAHTTAATAIEITPGTQFSGFPQNRARSSEEQVGEEAGHEEREGVQQGENAKPAGGLAENLRREPARANASGRGTRLAARLQKGAPGRHARILVPSTVIVRLSVRTPPPRTSRSHCPTFEYARWPPQSVRYHWHRPLSDMEVTMFKALALSVLVLAGIASLSAQDGAIGTTGGPNITFAGCMSLPARRLRREPRIHSRRHQAQAWQRLGRRDLVDRLQSVLRSHRVRIPGLQRCASDLPRKHPVCRRGVERRCLLARRPV